MSDADLPNIDEDRMLDGLRTRRTFGASGSGWMGHVVHPERSEPGSLRSGYLDLG